jgi:hypothetical protein
VNIHPNVFHHVLDQAASSGWQVVQEPDRLRILLAGVSPGTSIEGVQTAVAGALAAADAAPLPLEIRVVDYVERTPLGNAPFVRAGAGGRDRP